MAQPPRLFLGGVLACLVGINGWFLFGQNNDSQYSIAAKSKSRSGPHSPPVEDVLAGHRTLGQTIDLQSLTPVGSHHQMVGSRLPRVIMFLRHDCACGEELARVLEQIALLLEGTALVCAVVDEPGSGDTALSELSKSRVPLLCDSSHAVARKLGIPRAGFTVLTDRSGMVTHLWPGVSLPMIRELAEATAPSLALDLKVRFPDLTGAPRAGCPIVALGMGEVR